MLSLQGGVSISGHTGPMGVNVVGVATENQGEGEGKTFSETW